MLGQLLEEWNSINASNQRNHQSRSVRKTPWNFLDRYLQAVKKHLPSRRQDDIIAELRANMESQLEDKEAELGRPSRQQRLGLAQANGRPHDGGRALPATAVPHRSRDISHLFVRPAQGDRVGRDRLLGSRRGCHSPHRAQRRSSACFGAAYPRHPDHHSRLGHGGFRGSRVLRHTLSGKVPAHRRPIWRVESQHSATRGEDDAHRPQNRAPSRKL